MAFHPKLSVEQAVAVLERRTTNNFISHMQAHGIKDPTRYLKFK